MSDAELSLRANGSRERAPDDRLRICLVIASAAKQSIYRLGERKLECFVAEFIIGAAEGGTRWLFATTARLYEN